MNDADLLGHIRTAWEAADPAPPGLADRILFALQLENLEYELMRLQDTEELVGARSGSGVETVTFTGDHLTVMLMLPRAGDPERRLDGWLAPGAALRVELRAGGTRRDTVASPDGRFAFSDVPAGLLQLVVHPTDGATVALARPVVTPAIQL
jgi:hypothetical protein